MNLIYFFFRFQYYSNSYNSQIKNLQILLKGTIMTDLTESKQFITDDISTIQSSNQIESNLNIKLTQLQEAQRVGNYVKADQLKAQIEKLKTHFKQKKLHQMVSNHKKEKKKIQHEQQSGINELIQAWNRKIANYDCQKVKLKQELLAKHQEEFKKAKQTLQIQISNRIKQSSECLNLRKIQEQMKKQKKYSQAHQIQLQILQMEKKERVVFEKQRQVKIQNALATLKTKQKVQIEALNKKIESTQKQMQKEKEKQIQKLKLKHMNSMKDLLSLQQKQLLGQKGQIKSRAMLSSARSRPKFTSYKKIVMY